MSSTRSILRLGAMLLIGALVVIAAPTGSVAQTRPSAEKVNGAYRLFFAGHLTGRGTAAVGARSINIIGQVADEAGAEGNFRARCTRTGNHFSGTGAAPGGGTVTVKGRLDPSNKALRAARISFTYVVSSGQTGRAVGDRPGKP